MTVIIVITSSALAKFFYRRYRLEEGWILAVLAALIHGIGFVLYNVQTKLGKSEPNPVSWFLWAFLATLNALSFSAMNSLVSALQFLTGSIGCIVTFLYVLVIGKFKVPKMQEWGMFLLGLVAIVVWKLSGPTNANLILVGIVVWSFVPSVVGVLSDPRKERSTAWWFWTTATTITTLHTFMFKGGWTISMVMPIVLVSTHGIVALLSSKSRKERWVLVRNRHLNSLHYALDKANELALEYSESSIFPSKQEAKFDLIAGYLRGRIEKMESVL